MPLSGTVTSLFYGKLSLTSSFMAINANIFIIEILILSHSIWKDITIERLYTSGGPSSVKTEVKTLCIS